MSPTQSRTTLLALASSLLFAGAALAQSAVAHISGKAAPGDTVLIQNVDTGFKREVAVKDNGRYQLRNLPVGTFSVTVKHKDGTSDTPKQVELRVGVTARVE